MSSLGASALIWSFSSSILYLLLLRPAECSALLASCLSEARRQSVDKTAFKKNAVLPFRLPDCEAVARSALAVGTRGYVASRNKSIWHISIECRLVLLQKEVL